MIKKYLPTSLLGRTILIILVPLLLLQIAVSIVFFDRHWSKMTERLSYAVAGEMVGAIQAVNQNPDEFNEIRLLLKNTVQLEMGFFEGQEELYLNGKEEVAKSFGFRVEDSIETDLAREIRQFGDYTFDIAVYEDQKTIVVRFLLDNGVIEFTVPERRLFSSSSYIFILWMIGLSVLLFTIAMLFMRNQIRPIYRLGLIAGRLGRGIPVGKIKPSGAREVRQAAEAFINMQDRINQFVNQRTTMLAAVSHDLRTPLTRLKLQLEMIEDGDDKKAMSSDIKDMEDMIEGYLAFAKGDDGEEMQRVAVADVYIQMQEDAKRLGLDVETDEVPSETTFIWAKPQALKRVFDNLLSNARRYGTKVKLQCDTDKDSQQGHVRFIIEDNGQGVREDQLADLIKPFYRGEASRNQKTGGVGLGLAIAHDIITAHGGKLTFDNSTKMGGLTVIVTLPF